MQSKLIFLTLLFSLLFLTVLIVKPSQVLAADQCSMSPQETRLCDNNDLIKCPAGGANEGEVCSSGHKYCQYESTGNIWTDCIIEINNCATQCSSAPKTNKCTDWQFVNGSSACQDKIGSAADGPGGCCDTAGGCISTPEQIQTCSRSNGACMSGKSCEICTPDCSGADNECKSAQPYKSDGCGGSCYGKKEKCSAQLPDNNPPKDTSDSSFCDSHGGVFKVNTYCNEFGAKLHLD